MKTHLLTVLSLACMSVGMLVALVPWLVADSHEAYQASALSQGARFVGLALIFAPGAFHFLWGLLSAVISLHIMCVRMNRWVWRKWGYLLTITGSALYIMSPGPDDMENSTSVMLGGIVIGVSMVALGWLVNHWPPRAYWPYIMGRAVFPPRSTSYPYISNVEECGD